MRFYERVLKGKLEALLTNSQTPAAEHVPPGNADRIMHAYLVFDGGVLMAGDSLVGHSYEGMKGFSLALTYPEVAEAERVFTELGEGGNVTMPFQPTFWAERFGMVTDRYGTHWIVNGGSAPAAE
jgi:PhnB protein